MFIMKFLAKFVFFNLMFFCSSNLFAQGVGYGFEAISTGSPLAGKGANAVGNFPAQIIDTVSQISVYAGNKYFIKSWNQLNIAYSSHFKQFNFGVGFANDGFEGFNFSKASIALARKINNTQLGLAFEAWQWSVQDAHYQLLPALSWGGKSEILKNKLFASINAITILGGKQEGNLLSRNSIYGLVTFVPLKKFQTYIGINAIENQDYLLNLGYSYTFTNQIVLNQSFIFQTTAANLGVKVPIKQYKIGYVAQWNMVLGISQGIQLEYFFK